MVQYIMAPIKKVKNVVKENTSGQINHIIMGIGRPMSFMAMVNISGLMGVGIKVHGKET